MRTFEEPMLMDHIKSSFGVVADTSMATRKAVRVALKGQSVFLEAVR